MKRIQCLLIFAISVFVNPIFAQNNQTKNTDDYLKLSWKQIATKMPAEWYGSNDAKLVAENVLLCQKDIGGWAKNKPYHHVFTDEEKNQFIEARSEIGATFDNGATIMELGFLVNVYSFFKDEKYKTAFLKGLDYIFVSQYENGGWPQFYPFREGKSVAYASNITYNDDAMVNILKLLRDIVYDKKNYPMIQLDSIYKSKANQAFENGINCIIKTQIIVDGKPTVWCAQHNAITLEPTVARKYELASFSGEESAGIAQFLMTLRKPSKEIIFSVDCAVKWFEDHKIKGIKLIKEKGVDGKKNIVVVEDKSAPPVWARFYDLETEKPFFCDRDGIKKNSLADISYERRNGYDWYTTSPAELIAEYSEWKEKLHD